MWSLIRNPSKCDRVREAENVLWKNGLFHYLAIRGGIWKCVCLVVIFGRIVVSRWRQDICPDLMILLEGVCLQRCLSLLERWSLRGGWDCGGLGALWVPGRWQWSRQHLEMKDLEENSLWLWGILYTNVAQWPVLPLVARLIHPYLKETWAQLGRLIPEAPQGIKSPSLFFLLAPGTMFYR